MADLYEWNIQSLVDCAHTRQRVIADSRLLTISRKMLFLLHHIMNSMPAAQTVCNARHNNDINVEVTTLRRPFCCLHWNELATNMTHTATARTSEILR